MGNRPKFFCSESDCLVRQEQQELQSWRKDRSRSTNVPWTGIALSGGGIRSATFCLGVLRALAKKNHLKHFDYISTVSGGGYISCALQWWWHQPEQPSEGELGTGNSDFPFGTSEPSSNERDDRFKEERLRRLRDHGNYLAPNGNYWSIFGAVARAILLNLVVWIPLIGLAFYGIASADGLLKEYWHHPSVLDPYLPSLVPYASPFFYKVLLFLSISLIVIFILSINGYSFQTIFSKEGEVTNVHFVYAVSFLFATVSTAYLLYTIIADDSKFHVLVPALVIVGFLIALAFFWKALILRIMQLLKYPKGVGEAYAFRRMIDDVFGMLFPYFLVIVLFGVIPIVSDLASQASTEDSFWDFVLGLVAVGGGVAATLWGYFQLFRNYAPALATALFLPIGGALFLFGILIIGYYFGASFSIATGTDLLGDINFQPPLPRSDYFRIAVLVIFLASIVAAFFVNINTIGLGRFYRDRLMEAYMPDPKADSSTRATSPADGLYLWKLWDGVSPAGPYPLINSNVVMVNERTKKYRLRGGDSFVLSPNFCGSEVTGWGRTKDALPYFSLATAMSVSAAAVNPFTGYVGTGPTRDRLVSIVLALLNLRLGYWVRNPVQRCFRDWPRTPNHIFPGLYYTVVPGGGHQRNKYFVELTDGGHFDNLGIYELVRRKCKVILVCDGEMDRKTSYAALVSVQRRIKDDFGARIIFDPEAGPERLVEDEKMDYPSDAFMADETHFVATIQYADKSQGRIIYVKARMINALSFEVKAYKGAHPDFPHEDTVDQFFDPEQFDAHCELGYRACMSADPDIGKVLRWSGN